MAEMVERVDVNEMVDKLRILDHCGMYIYRHMIEA